ncbi:MAG TPA: UDP-N-acetylmuramoyl-L-alanyl-D-glutamate--2,6-diaminopimelate ligase [Gammaproteobacteria bacterium]|nr:UDP-N-acetylmuramoyl-L-alanyl-D-glutamate--2,6-diaminopimelate ligase [Gammaproteobacteria bacterium]
MTWDQSEYHSVQVGRLLRQSLGINIDIPIHLTGLALDSRKVSFGNGFFALNGNDEQGHKYIDKAINNGALAVFADQCSEYETITYRRDVPIIPIDKLSDHVGKIVDVFYYHPSSHIQVIGVTGTNGKTSVAYLIAAAFNSLGKVSAYSGTLGMGFVPGAMSHSGMTTPDSIALHKWLAEISQKGAEIVAMEVSSHSLKQKRVAGIRFDTAVFTNLSEEHQDYHDSLEDYAQTKSSLFEDPGLDSMVVNLDDALGRKIISNHTTNAKVVGYSLEKNESGLLDSIVASHVKSSLKGLSCDVNTPKGKGRLKSSLIGLFNLENLLAALGVLLKHEVPLVDALNALGQIDRIPGRMEYFGGGTKPNVYVDYAHTPDGLLKVLSSLRKKCKGQLWCVFGAGGDRDSSKRFSMGQVSERFSDRVILTNDNPRSECPRAIVEDIMAGMVCSWACEVELNRAAAIAQAIGQAKAGDIVLIAGKGHETYQEVMGIKHVFDDIEVVKLQLSLQAGAV